MISSRSNPIAFLESYKSEILLTLLLAGIQFCHILDFMILMPLGPQIMRTLEINPTQFSFLVSSYTLMAGLSGILISMFIDRFDRKKILILFFVAFIIGTLACGLAPTYHLLLFARSFTGAFGGVLTSIVLTIISDNYPYEKRGAAIGTVMAAFAVASIVGVPIGIYLANLHNFQTPFQVLGVLSLILCLAVWVLIPKQDHFILKSPPHPLSTFVMIFKNSNQKIALLLIFFLVCGQFTIIPFISPSFVLNAGLREDQLPMIYLFGGLCSMVAAPTFGKLADMYTKTKIFAIALLLSVVPIYLITNLSHTPLTLLIFISSSFFIAMSGRMVPAMSLVTAAAPPERRAGFLSIVSSVQQLSAAFAAWMGGQIIIQDRASESLLHYNYAGYIAIVFSLLTFVLSFRFKPEYNQ